MNTKLTRREPLGTLTTYELRDRKQHLECALRVQGMDDLTRAALQSRLTEVIAEQDERAAIRRREV